MRKYLFFFLCLFLFQPGFSQTSEKPNSSEIYQAIEKLNFLGSVLYVAAHPDDENTQLISYFSNEINARTGYLSLTRGDGGQNLIGPQIRELLGVLRTQELLAARKIDGGTQFFTRANDFGYSKTPKETLEIWNKKEVLSDVVWIFRKFRPDVIINRFNVESAGETHGHHTSSAMLSSKAFELAGNPNKFPNQLGFVDTWQPTRLFFNTSWWFYGSKDKFKKKMEHAEFFPIDVGVYYPLQGLSNTEISAHSRSQHKSQGFGVSGTRGREMEYLKLEKGEFPKNAETIFAGINTTWSRLNNGKPIGKILSEVQAEYNFKNPAASVPKLLQAYELIQKLKNNHWRKIKTKAIEEIILDAMGVYVEASTQKASAVPGEKIEITIEAINRSPVSAKLTSVVFSETRKKIQPQQKLENNRVFSTKTSLQLPDSMKISTPYWLNEKASLGMYHVEKQEWIGLPETPASLTTTITLSIDGTEMSVQKPVVYKTTDPVQGEVRKPFSIVPKVSVGMDENVILFADDTPKTIQVLVKTFQDKLQGTLSLSVPENWKVHPKEVAVKLPKKGMEKTISFQVIPPKKQEEVFLRPQFSSKGISYSNELVSFDYPHIPKQSVLRPAKTKLVRLNIQKKGEKIAYIEGAGDVVAENLEQIGYAVQLLTPEKITSERLSTFDAVVVGIRAYNTVEKLASKQAILFDYVKNGGTMIVQYNKSFRLKTENLAPYDLQLSHNRVTDEHSEVQFLAKNHPVLNEPNQITQADFEGWVQERGLYFPKEWGKEFTPVLGMKDEGEPLQKGSLLVAKYGKGYYIYTGLSFFREFPAGVSGAFRLFANLISIGN